MKVTRVGVDLLMRASDDVPASLTQFRDALRAGRPPPCPSRRRRICRAWRHLTAFDGAALDSLVRDAPLARVGALCEALSTKGPSQQVFWCCANATGGARLPQASPDLIERLDKALFAHPATVDALRTFFSCGGDGPHAEGAGRSQKRRGDAKRGTIRAARRFSKRCPQMADSVIEDADALRNVRGPGLKGLPMDASRRTRRAARA